METFQHAILHDQDLTGEQKRIWLECKVYCPDCDDYTAKLVEGISADVRGVGVDVSTFYCGRCNSTWSE
jgi:transposase-like protein